MSKPVDPLTPIPGVRICTNDLAIIGQHAIGVIGYQGKGIPTVERLLQHSIADAIWELTLLCDEVDNIDAVTDTHGVSTRLRSLLGRLELADQAGNIVKLAKLPTGQHPDGRESEGTNA